MRKYLLTALSFLSLTACNAPAFYAPMPMGNSFYQPTAPQQMLSRFSTAPRGDWFAKLPAQLQSYYAPAQGQSGLNLFKNLSQVIRQNQWVPSYNEARAYMYSTADHLRQGNNEGVIAHYSQLFISGLGGNGNDYREPGDLNQDGLPGDFINCEHTWPQSFFKEAMPMKADMHHLFPTLSHPNGMRNNHPIGMAEGIEVYRTSSGAKLGVVDKSGRHNPADIRRWYNLPWNQQPQDIMRRDLQPTFEPPDAAKGNTARAMLYFYLRYYDQNIRQGGYDEQRFWDSKVRTYIAWAQADPVDEQERQRHEKVAQLQKNRNPFVDIPQLADIIGEATFVAGP